MSEEELTFIKKMEMAFQRNEKAYNRTKTLLVGAVSILLAISVTLGAANITGVASNKTDIANIKLENTKILLEIELVKKDYADVFTINRLIQSQNLQTEILLRIDRKEIKTIEQVQEIFDKQRMQWLNEKAESISRGASMEAKK